VTSSKVKLSRAARNLMVRLNRTPEGREHQRLVKLMPRRPKDYDPWGRVERWSDPGRAYPDCSCDCKFARWLDGPLGSDWCVCTNPNSHRVGLLTFEHQGCEKFTTKRGGT
jgi:hypothetical protein